MESERRQISQSNGSNKHHTDVSGSPETSYPPVSEAQPEEMMSYARRYVTAAILCLVNLLNYMDRYTIAGVLPDVKDFYSIGNGDAGLLQAIFVVGFMLTAPGFGFAGDRYNRKWLMVGGIALWSGVTLISSFIPSNLFWLFVVLRGIVGIGEASYVTIAPSIISDMFDVGPKRSYMLMCFFYAIPVGSGLGYIVGSNIAHAIGKGWQWALRLTPVLGAVCLLLIIIVTREPPRGMAEDGANHRSNSTVKEDLISLLKNKTFVLSTFGNTCVTFVSGALALFAPTFMLEAYRVSGDALIGLELVSTYTGVITAVAGLVGVAAGTLIAKKVKEKHTNGDALVCGVGLLACTPFLFGGLVLCEFNMIPTWVLIMIGEILLFMNWPLVVDMLLYTVPATRRSTAVAVQILVCHALGDAASPYLLGEMSDALRGDKPENSYYSFKALQNSLFVCLFVTVLGGLFFLLSSLSLAKDKKAAAAETKGSAVGGPAMSPRPSHYPTLPLDDMAPLLDAEESFEPVDDDVLILPT